MERHDVNFDGQMHKADSVDSDGGKRSREIEKQQGEDNEVSRTQIARSSVFKMPVRSMAGVGGHPGM